MAPAWRPALCIWGAILDLACSREAARAVLDMRGCGVEIGTENPKAPFRQGYRHMRSFNSSPRPVCQARLPHSYSGVVAAPIPLVRGRQGHRSRVPGGPRPVPEGNVEGDVHKNCRLMQRHSSRAPPRPGHRNRLGMLGTMATSEPHRNPAPGLKTSPMYKSTSRLYTPKKPKAGPMTHDQD